MKVLNTILLVQCMSYLYIGIHLYVMNVMRWKWTDWTDKATLNDTVSVTVIKIMYKLSCFYY